MTLMMKDPPVKGFKPPVLSPETLRSAAMRCETAQPHKQSRALAVLAKVSKSLKARRRGMTINEKYSTRERLNSLVQTFERSASPAVVDVLRDAYKYYCA